MGDREGAAQPANGPGRGANRLAVLGARKIGFLTKNEDFADARIELDESKSLDSVRDVPWRVRRL